MATIQQRQTKKGKPRYRALVRRQGSQLSKTFKRKRDASQWARKMDDMLIGGDGIAKNTTGEMIDRYIESVLPTKKTGHRQAQQLLMWKSLIGHIALEKIQPRHIASGRDALAKDKSPSTVVRYLAALSHAFTIAIKDWQWLTENPAKMIMWPKEPRGRVRFLSDAELERLIAACELSKSRYLAAVVRLALLTGMRRGEILNLQWRHVDIKHSRLILTETKNNECRRVPLVPSAQHLIDHYRSTLQSAPDVYVFGGSKPVDITHAWRQALRRAEITDFRFHDLRHTAASYLAMSGATTQEIAEILGHKTLSMVKRYAHLTTDHAETVLNRLESVYCWEDK